MNQGAFCAASQYHSIGGGNWIQMHAGKTWIGGGVILDQVVLGTLQRGSSEASQTIAILLNGHLNSKADAVPEHLPGR